LVPACLMYTVATNMYGLKKLKTKSSKWNNWASITPSCVPNWFACSKHALQWVGAWGTRIVLGPSKG
jgi:hypothetical protein